MKLTKMNKAGIAILCTLVPAAAAGVTVGVVLSALPKQENQASFSFGNNALYTPKQDAMPAMNATRKEIIEQWIANIKQDPTIFYDDVHYAINQELFIPDDQRYLFTALPSGNIDFKWFQIDKDQYQNNTISFEMEYYYTVEVNKEAQILGPNWWKAEFSGRIDVYDFPLTAATSEDNILIGTSQGYSGENIPYYAVNLDAEGIAQKDWYIHGIEIGYVWDKAGNRYETAHNGWIGGYDTTYTHAELGYVIETIPFLYNWPSGSSKCFSISNYSLKNNIKD